MTVVGEAILDRWWMGGSRRLSREAPAPIVEVSAQVDAPGGAANTAVNLSALGVRVRLVSAVGPDAAGDRMLELLVEAGVDVSGVIRSPLVRTVSKTRIVADDQVLVRADSGSLELDGDTRAELAAALGTAFGPGLEDSDALVVSDYGSGLLSDPVVSALCRAHRPGQVVVDAHDPAAWRALAPDVAVPNAREAEALLGHSLGDGPGRASAVAASADRLRSAAGATALVVTLDRDGAVLVAPESVPFTTHAHPVSEKYASGAGDTFTASLTAALCVGATLEDATNLGQFAADVALRHLGTSVCSSEELAAQALPRLPAVLTPASLASAIRRDREQGLRIVFTNGCFDVLHLGHTSYLRQARELGDRLVVAVNSDESVRRLKGPDRPVNAQSDRAAVLAALECVDYVTVFDGETPIPLIERLQPQVYVKGGDYSAEMLAEADVVRGYGGEVVMVGYVPAHSTTALVDRIRSGGRE